MFTSGRLPLPALAEPSPRRSRRPPLKGVPPPSVSSSSSSLTISARLNSSTPNSSAAAPQQQLLPALVISTGHDARAPATTTARRTQARPSAIAQDWRRRHPPSTRSPSPSSASFASSFSPLTASIAAWSSGVIALPNLDMSRRAIDVDMDTDKSSPSATTAAFDTTAKGDLIVDLDKVLNPHKSSPRRRTETGDTDGSDFQLVRISQEGDMARMQADVPFLSDYSTRGEGSTKQRTQVVVPPPLGNDKPLLSFSTALRARNQSNQSTDHYGTSSSTHAAINHTGSVSLARTASSSSSSHDDGLSTPATSAYAYSPVMKQSQDEARSQGKTFADVGWSPTTVIPLTASLPSPPEDVASVSTKKRGSAGPGPAILDPRFSFPLRKNGGKPISAPMTRSNDLSGNWGIQKSYVASLGLTPLIADGHFTDGRSGKARSTRSSFDPSSAFDLAASGSVAGLPNRRPSLPSAEPETGLSHTLLCPSVRSVARSRNNSKKGNNKASNETSGRMHSSFVRGQCAGVRTEPTSAATSDVEDQNIAPLHVSRSGRNRHASTPPAQIEMTFPAGPHLTHTANSSTEAFTYPHPRLHAFELEADIDVGPVETLRSSSSLDWGSVRRVLQEQEEFQKERDEWSDASATAIGAKWNGAGRRRRRRHHRFDSGSGSDAGMKRTLRSSDSAPMLRGLAIYGSIDHGKRKPLQRRDLSSGSQAADGLFRPPPRRESLVQKARHQGSSGSSAVAFPTQGKGQRSHSKQGNPGSEHVKKLASLYRSNSVTAPSDRHKLVPSRPVESPSKSTMDGAGSFRTTRPPPPIPSGVTPFSPLVNKKHEPQLARLMTDFPPAATYSRNPQSSDEPIASTSPASTDDTSRSGEPMPSPRSRATSGASYLNLNVVNTPLAPDTAESPLGRPSLASLRRVKGSDFCPPNSGDDTFGVAGQRYSTATESFYSVDSNPPTLGDVLPSPISDYFGGLRNSYASTPPHSLPIERTRMVATSSHSRRSVGSVMSASRNSSSSRPPSMAEGSLNLDEEGYTFEDLFFRPPPTRHDSIAVSEDQYPLTVTTSFFPDLEVQASPELYGANRAQDSDISTVPSASLARMTALSFNRTTTARTCESETSDSFETAEEGPGSPTSVRKDSPFENAPLEHTYASSRPSSPLEPRRLSISTVIGVSPTLIRVQDTAPGPMPPATPSSHSSPPPQSFLDLSASPDAAPSERTESSFLFFESSGDSSTIIPSRRAPRISQVPNDESVLPSFSPVSSPRATLIGDLHPDPSTGSSAMFIEVALALSRESSPSNLDMGDDEEELSFTSSFPTDVSPSVVSSPRATFAPGQLLSPRLREFIADDAASIATSTASSGVINSFDPSRGSGLSAWSAVSKFPLPPSEEGEEDGVEAEANDPSTDETPRPHSPVPAPALANALVGSLLQVSDADSDTHSVRSMATLRRNRSTPNLSSRSSLTVDTDAWTVAASTIRARLSEEAYQSSDDDLGRLRRVMSGPAAVEDLPDAPTTTRFVNPAIFSERLQARRRVWSLGPTIRSFFTSSNDDGTTSSTADPTPEGSRASSTQFSSRRSSWKHERTSSDPSVYQPRWLEGPEEKIS